MISPAEFTAQFLTEAESRGFSSTILADVSGVPITVFTRQPEQNPTQAAHLYLSSGVHGDEPAAPLALLRLIKEDRFPRNLSITLLPLVNPSGFAARTRENASGHDLNRDFRAPRNPETRAVKRLIDSLPSIDLSISLHEDWETTGFYMYAVSPSAAEDSFRNVLEDVSKVGPIEKATEIDDSNADRGLISPPIGESIEAREDWPEAFLLYSKNRHTHLTTESPSTLPLEVRVAMQTTAVISAIHHLLPRIIDSGD